MKAQRPVVNKGMPKDVYTVQCTGHHGITLYSVLIITYQAFIEIIEISSPAKNECYYVVLFRGARAKP